MTFKFTVKIDNGEKKMQFITDGEYLVSKATYERQRKNNRQSFTAFFKELTDPNNGNYNWMEVENYGLEAGRFNATEEMEDYVLTYIDSDEVEIDFDDVYNILGKVLTKTTGLPFNKVANRRRYVRSHY